jgi:predicted alpha-1,6-mannanase (GH76 family)
MSTVFTIQAQTELNLRSDTAYNAYNAAFLYTSGTTQYYKEALNVASKDYFWRQALDIQGIEDEYWRTKNPATKTLIGNLLHTFMAQNGTTNWDWNDYNDDLCWAGLAMAKGYQITGDTAFLRMEKYAFNRLYNRGWDMTDGGGIWWDVNHANKSGLSNNPAADLACYIYESNPDSTVYLTKAVAIVKWLINTLVNKTTGAVSENTGGGGANTYNVGSFIGAANHAHRLTGDTSLYAYAKRSVDYIIKTKFNNGVMTSGQRQGTSQSEFARGMGEFVRDNNMWSTYYSWMKLNADAAWKIRRTDLNLSWCNWTQQMPSDNITTSVECIGSVIMLSVTPLVPHGFTDGALYRLAPKINGGSALDIASTSIGTQAEINSWNNAGDQKFTVVPLGTGYYRLVPGNAPGTSLAVYGGSSADNTPIQISATAADSSQYWKLVDDYDGYYKLKPKCAPASCLNVTATSDGTKCVLMPESFGDNERWQLLPTTTGIIPGNNPGSDNPDLDVRMYENPTQKTLIVKSSTLPADGRYIIFDAEGKTVLQGRLTRDKIDIRAMKSGVYFIKLTGKNMTVGRKFMK